MKRLIIVYFLLITFLLAACSPKSTEPQPPEIIYGQDVCDTCQMIISDPKFASALLLEGDVYLKFDDVGDMFVHQMNHPELSVRAWFVHDYGSEQWLRGENAVYVFSPDITSPMDHGLAAFTDRAAAEAFAARYADARVLTFDETRLHVHVVEHGN